MKIIFQRGNDAKTRIEVDESETSRIRILDQSPNWRRVRVDDAPPKAAPAPSSAPAKGSDSKKAKEPKASTPKASPSTPPVTPVVEPDADGENDEPEDPANPPQTQKPEGGDKPPFAVKFVGAAIIESLAQAGFDSLDKVATATDEQLKGVVGVDDRVLGLLRKATGGAQ